MVRINHANVEKAARLLAEQNGTSHSQEKEVLLKNIHMHESKYFLKSLLTRTVYEFALIDPWTQKINMVLAEYI